VTPARRVKEHVVRIDTRLLCKHLFLLVIALTAADSTSWHEACSVAPCACVRAAARAAPSKARRPCRGAALTNQWLGANESYFVPHVAPLILETLFRRYLGGEPNLEAVESGRAKMQTALDAADRALQSSPYLAGETFSLADIHFMPYLEYLEKTEQDLPVNRRKNLAAWWQRVSQRPTWQKVARSGPQPWETGMAAEVIENRLRSQTV